MAVLIRNNEPSLVDMSTKDFIKLGIHGVYTTMKTVTSYEYIFNFTVHMKNLHKYSTNFLKMQVNDNNEKCISYILENLTLENIRRISSENVKRGFEFLNALNDDIKRKHFSENSNYMVMITITWDKDNKSIASKDPFSILCYIKCLPKHDSSVQIDIMCGTRKLPNIKYSDVFEVREKLLKLKCEDSHEIVLYNENDEITEGLTCNFFCFFNDTLYTAKDELVLKGTIREQIIDLCEREGIKFKKESIHIRDIELFEFCFICSTTRNIIPIKKIILFSEHKKSFEKYVNHPILMNLQEKLMQEIERKKEKYNMYIC
ncbi:aminodeoxychorismate lyase, putative [Plasmodium ovale]|uniref:Aminodeoxychorismate lyase n=2 Tax=Plasmodium ovale TaxID=36330 RepID=A0A1A8W3H9_PLAOA|nr:hypothetical protein POVCU2_0037730 [Plasmodium ovale curtisi]SBS96943.1 hypothetical protein POVCU1_034670 [Plasmodium ovale curtisi]SCP05698.1 aminodeoxychorismate lyase, putative [Plasmodium ovale]